MNIRKSCPCCESSNIQFKNLPQYHSLCLQCDHIHKLSKEPNKQPDYTHKSQRTVRLMSDTNKKNAERLSFIKRSIEITDLSRVLEIGAAEGFFAQSFLAENGTQSHYDAIEPSQDSIECRKIVNTLYTEQIENIEFPERHYDLVFSFHVLEHIYELDPFISSSFRILKDSCYLILEVPNRHGNRRVPWDFNPEHIHIFNSLSILNLLDRHQFEVVGLETGGFESPYYNDSLRLVAQKKSSTDHAQALKNTFHQLIKNENIAFWGAGGDFLSYVLPYIEQETTPLIFDSTINKKVSDTLVSTNPENIKDHKGKILVCSYQFENEIVELLGRQYAIKNDRILRLSDIIESQRLPGESNRNETET